MTEDRDTGVRLHETHVCRDCGAEITLPYAAPAAEPVPPDPEELYRRRQAGPPPGKLEVAAEPVPLTLDAPYTHKCPEDHITRIEP